jgi:hypothetical protein
MPVVWPRRIRKTLPYTADELLVRDCLTDAKRILRVNAGSELIHITPPTEVASVGGCLGEVYPPGGGEIGADPSWYDHYAVRIGGRFYDCMTGPAGLSEAEYRHLFRPKPVPIGHSAGTMTWACTPRTGTRAA